MENEKNTQVNDNSSVENVICDEDSIKNSFINEFQPVVDGDIEEINAIDISMSEEKDKKNDGNTELHKASGLNVSDSDDTDDKLKEADIVSAAGKLVERLSDAGKFSYLGLCSTVLSLLFESAKEKYGIFHFLGICITGLLG